MNKILKHILYTIILLISVLYIPDLFAWYNIPWTTKLHSVSINTAVSSDPVTDINMIWFKLLNKVKLVLEWLLVLFIVYIWVQMIYSMWSDEDTLSKAKRQLWYSIVALLFINMPWALYKAFHKPEYETIWPSTNFNSNSQSLFFDYFNFGYTFWDQVVWFLEVAIFAIAVVVLVYQAIKLIASAWKEEVVSQTKTKILYSILALVFVWIIEAWKSFAFKLDVWKVTNIFWELANLALFFAGPIAFFFLTLAAYYYITSAWDEEKIKKAKSIVINTILATLILLASYTFLLDLAEL